MSNYVLNFLFEKLYIILIIALDIKLFNFYISKMSLSFLELLLYLQELCLSLVNYLKYFLSPFKFSSETCLLVLLINILFCNKKYRIAFNENIKFPYALWYHIMNINICWIIQGFLISIKDPLLIIQTFILMRS